MRNRADRCASCGRDEAVGVITRVVRDGPLAGEPTHVKPAAGEKLLILSLTGKTMWVSVGKCCAENPDLKAIWRAVTEAAAFVQHNRIELNRAVGAKVTRQTPEQERKALEQIAAFAWDAPLDVIARKHVHR